MVGITQIGTMAESANPKWATERVRGKQANSANQDKLNVSSAGVYAAKLATQDTTLQDKLREERIQQIREALDKGTYQVQQVVLQVASRITKYLQA